METQESAVSGTTTTMPSLQQKTDVLYWLELKPACEQNVQSKSR